VNQEKRWYPIDVLCRALRVSRAGYFAWCRGRRGLRQYADAVLLAKIRVIYSENDRNYGSPRIYDELREKEVSCSKERVERLMRENGLAAKHKRKFKVTTNSDHDLPVSPNIDPVARTPSGGAPGDETARV